MYLVKMGPIFDSSSSNYLATYQKILRGYLDIKIYWILPEPLLKSMTVIILVVYTIPADIHCCHRWSDITDGTWSPLCNAGGIQFYIFRHKLGCTPWPIWSLVLALCTFGIFGTRFPSLHALVAPALKCIPSIFWWM